MPVARQRGIFPLPVDGKVLGKSNFAPCGRSRKVCRRVLTKAHRLNWYHGGLLALNEVAGFAGVSSGKPSAVLNTFLSQMERQYFLSGKPPASLTSDGAIKELLSHCGHYHAR